MGTYSNVIIKYKNGYIIKNYKMLKIIFFYIIQLMFHFMIFMFIALIIFDIKNYKSDWYILLGFTLMFLFFCIKSFNEMKIIYILDKEIIFKYGLFPYFKIRKIKINNIKEISINNNSSKYATYKFKYFVKEYMYNVDIIDYKCNAYRIYRSSAYNDELLTFAENIGKIINIDINDQNNNEGKNNIYKNIII